MKQGMLRRPPLRTIKLYHHCTNESVRASSAVSVRGTLGRWFGGDMGHRFVPEALQPRQPVHNTRTDKRASA